MQCHTNSWVYIFIYIYVIETRKGIILPYVQEVVTHFYIVTHYINWGNYFLDTQYELFSRISGVTLPLSQK